MPSPQFQHQGQRPAISRKSRLSFIIPCPISPSLLWTGVLAGGICALSAPGPGLWPFAWGGLIPVFRALLFQTQRPSGALPAFYLGLTFGAVFHGIYMAWLLALHPMRWLGLSNFISMLGASAAWGIVVLSGAIGFAVLFSLYAIISKTLWKLPKAYYWLLCLLIFPTLWVFWFELYQLNAFWIPWALLDYTQLQLPLMRSLITASGTSHSVAWLLVAFNLALSGILYRLSLPRRFITAGIVLIFLVFVWLTPSGKDSSAHLPIPVSAYQGGVDIGVIKTGSALEAASTQAYLEPLAKARYTSGQLIVLPEEGIVSEWVNEARPFESKTLGYLQALCDQRGIAIITGLGTYRQNLKRQEGESSATAYNANVLLQPGQPPQFYDKIHLVPMGETVPYLSPGLANALLKDWHIPYQFMFESGQRQTVLSLQASNGKAPLKIGALICFELLYPELSAAYKQSGVKLLVNSSNLGWFHQHQWLSDQFIAIGQARAAENTVPVVISANTGPSAMISESGVVLRQSETSGREWIILTPGLKAPY